MYGDQASTPKLYYHLVYPGFPWHNCDTLWNLHTFYFILKFSFLTEEARVGYSRCAKHCTSCLEPRKGLIPLHSVPVLE